MNYIVLYFGGNSSRPGQSGAGRKMMNFSLGSVKGENVNLERMRQAFVDLYVEKYKDFRLSARDRYGDTGNINRLRSEAANDARHFDNVIRNLSRQYDVTLYSGSAPKGYTSMSSSYNSSFSEAFNKLDGKKIQSVAIVLNPDLVKKYRSMRGKKK